MPDRSPTAARPAQRTGATHRPRALGYLIALGIFLIDQLSKWYVVDRLRLPEVLQIRILPILDLTWVRNFGVSMGLLTASSDVARWLLVLLTGSIAGGVAVWLWRERKTPDMMALGLVLGGALGNILDRIRLGYVADFLDLHFWGIQPFLVFNVADAAITIGVLLLLLRAFLTRDGASPSENVHA